MTMVRDFERPLRAAAQPFPDLGGGTPDEAPRVASIPRVPGRAVRAPRFTPEQTRLEIIAQSPTLIELEVDRRIRRDYDEQGWTFPDGDELSFRRTAYRDAVWRDVNLVRERDRGASVLSVGLGAGGFALETAYRPFAAVYGFMSGATPEDSLRQAMDGLVGAEPFRKQGRNIGFVRLLPDDDWFPLDISLRDIAGLGSEALIDGVFIGRAARAVKGVATANSLGVRPTTFVADLPSIREFSAHVATSRNPISRAINSAVMPDANLATEYGRVAAGARNAMIASDGLTAVALSGYDSWARRFSGRPAFGRNGWLFTLSREGEITNVASHVEGASRAWNDVLSNPGNYDFTPQQRQFLDEVLYPLINDADAMRVRAGLPTLARDTSPEGWFYVPRSVTELDNIPTRGSNPAFDRTYETMAEGIAAGVRYDHDLRAVLQAHVRGSYQAVVNKQLNEALEAVEIAAARVREGIARVRTPAAREAMKEGRTVRRQFRDAIAEIERQAATPSISDDAVERAAALGERVAGLAQQAAQTERIPVDSWRGRWFPTEIADELNQVLPPLTDDSNVFGRGFEAIGDTIRTNSAIFDVGVSLLHGIPMLFNDPRAWSRATGASVFSLLDPTITSRYMRDHIDTFQRMAKAGVPVGDNEIFAALRQGRATNLFGLIQQVTERLPGLSDSTSDELTRVLNTMKNQSYGRFNASYDAFLAVGRSMMWEGLEGNIRDPQVLARHLRNMTGGLDSRALGVSRNQRGFESTWLAFAPRYTRSVGALLAEMFDSDPALRRAAQEAVAKTVGGVATLYVATGAFMGKPVEEIMDGLDPTSGKRFLSHEINGDWVGLGGGMRSIFQMIGGSIALGAEVVTDPSRLLDLNMGSVFSSRDNPLLSYVESRGAPGQTLVRAAIEAFSGGEYNTLPYNEVYNSIDLLKHVGKSSLPFALQGIIEGEQIGTVGAAFGGLRTSAQTPRERSAAVVDRALMRAGLSDFETLAGAEGDSYAGQIARGTLTPEERAEVDRIEADRIDALRQANLVRNDPMAKGLLASIDAYERVTQFITENPTDLRAIREFASQQMEAARAIREEPGVAAALARLPESQTEIGRDIERYYSLFDIEDPVERDEQEAAFRQNIGEARYARVVNNVFAVTRPMPEQWQQIQQGKKVLTETGFFDLGDPAWEMVQRRAAEVGLDDPAIESAASYSEWYEAEVDRREALLVAQGWKPEEARQRARNEATRIPVATAFGDALTLQRLAWVQANPDGARSAYALGYLSAGDRNTIAAGALPAAPEAAGPPPVTSIDLAREHEEGASYDDLARKYGLTAEAVRSRIRRATGR